MIWLVGTMWLALAAALLIGIALGWVLFRAGRRTIKQSEWDRVEEEKTARQGRIRELDDEVKRLRPVAARVPALEGEKAGYHAAQRRVAELEAESNSLRTAAASTSEIENETAELRSELTNRAVRIGDLERELAQTKATSTVDLREAPAPADQPTQAATLAAPAATASAVSALPPPPTSASASSTSPTAPSTSLADAELRRQMAARDRRIEQLESRIRRLEAPSNGEPASGGSRGNGTSAQQTVIGTPTATAPVTAAPAAAVPTAPVTTAPVVSTPAVPASSATAPVVSAPAPRTAPVVSGPTSPPAPAIAMPVQGANVSAAAQPSTLHTPPIPPAPARASGVKPASIVAESTSSASTTSDFAPAPPAPPVPASVERAVSSRRVATTTTTTAAAGGAGLVAGAAAAGTVDTMSQPDKSAIPATAPRRATEVEAGSSSDATRTAPVVGGRDDLTEIIGIGPKLEGMLNALGVTTLGQLAALDDPGIDDLQRKLPDFPGRVRRDDWAGQARRVLASRG